MPRATFVGHQLSGAPRVTLDTTFLPRIGETVAMRDFPPFPGQSLHKVLGVIHYPGGAPVVMLNRGFDLDEAKRRVPVDKSSAAKG